jgi:hypothetical protein
MLNKVVRMVTIGLERAQTVDINFIKEILTIAA